MLVPHSATGDVGRTTVLIPLRSLTSGKGRLADELDPDERIELIESMAERVVSAAHDLPVLIVYDDPSVVPWAAARGATTLRQSMPGLNNAITCARDHLRANGCERVIVAHADLPNAQDLRIMMTDHPVSIAPDRHRDGTNVLSIPTTIEFTFAYGPGSFENHLTIARGLGFEPHIIDAPDLAWDVDHPGDLPEP